jgi:hypothetical protein
VPFVGRNRVGKFCKGWEISEKNFTFNLTILSPQFPTPLCSFTFYHENSFQIQFPLPSSLSSFQNQNCIPKTERKISLKFSPTMHITSVPLSQLMRCKRHCCLISCILNFFVSSFCKLMPATAEGQGDDILGELGRRC